MPSNDDILDVAAAAFADKGYEGARVDEIAKDANVNKATLYYRIGGKEALYGAVLERIFSTKVAALQKMLESIDDAEQRVRAFTTILIEGDHPEYFSAIMLREIANGGRNLPDNVLPLMGRTVGALEKTLTEGAAQGRFKPVNPFLVHMMLVGACTLYTTAGPIRRRVGALAPKGSSLNTEMTINEAANAIADMLLGAVGASPTPREI